MHFSGVFVISERRDLGLYEMPLAMSLLGLGWGLCYFYLHLLFYI